MPEGFFFSQHFSINIIHFHLTNSKEMILTHTNNLFSLLSLSFLLFNHTSAVTLAATVGIGNVGGTAGVWIGGGVTTVSPPPRLDAAYSALQSWKSAISADPSAILDTWVGPNVCSYKGIFCKTAAAVGGGGPVVAGIDLNRANLQGILVDELSVLTDLTLIHLNSNRFHGVVPEAFRELVSLQELDLSNNQFSGNFPIPVLYIPNLLYLDLRFNSFTGPIPDGLFDKRLDAIFLNNNQFEGSIPQNLGNSPASVINLGYNNLTGTIPLSLGFMNSRLKEILFLNNQLTGCIPEGIGLFAQMQVLDVSFNSLMGHLPDTVACLNAIEVLNLEHNALSGTLPELVCSLRSLVNLTVAYNFFSGFSQECAKLFVRNVGFDFESNCIPGRDMQRPQPDCSMVPGGGLSCLRIPAAQPLVCGSIVGRLGDADGQPFSSP